MIVADGQDFTRNKRVHVKEIPILVIEKSQDEPKH